MKKTITKPEVKVMKLQKMNVIATSGEGGKDSEPSFIMSKARGFNVSDKF